ncbi:MAG: hypothetical protein IJX17_06085 [Clostridia bacterium]|nr:hypothetical protein [Clostridia bacterium]
MEKEKKKSKMKLFFMNLAKFIFNPRFIFCFGLAWLLTNGWSYIMLGIGTYYKIGWMIKVSSAYLAFLWLPISPEKIVTFAISILFLKLFFPKDKKTLGLLIDLYNKAKNSFKRKKQVKNDLNKKESEKVNETNKEKSNNNDNS